MKNKKLIVALILMLVIGFASVSTTLVLTGVVGIGENKDDFKVIFTKAKLNKTLRNEFIDKETKQTITYETDVLSIVDETSVLEYEVTNTSRNYDADVTIDLEIPENDYVYIEFEPKTMFIEAGKSKNGSVTVKLKKTADEDKTISMRCGFKVNSKKRESLGAEYVEPFSRAGTMMAAKNTDDNLESVWKYRDYVRKVVFENRMNPHETTEELTFDVSEAQDKSVMAYLIPLSTEELNVLFEEYIVSLTGMTEEEYKKYLIEQEGMTKIDAITQIFSMRNRGLFPLPEEDKDIYFEELIKSETGMTLEEYKKQIIEQEGVTEEEFNAEMDKMKKDMFGDDYSEYVFYNLYIQSDTGINANLDSSYLFFGFVSLQKIEGLEYFNTSSVTNMSHMFSECSNLSTIDLSHFDTSNVTDMSNMFAGEYDARRNSFSSLDFSSFNTSKVTNMSRMFLSCYINNLDLSGFDTSSVTDMSFMFMDNYLIELDLSNWNTSSVVDMTKMFSECYRLVKIDLSSFDTSNVTSMNSMFQSCSNLTELNLSSFDTKKVETMSGMFCGCGNLTSLDLSNFHTNSLKMIGDYYIFGGLFAGCDKLTYLDMSNFDFSLIRSDRKKYSFKGMPDNATIKVKDNAAQDWILALNGFDRPSAWTTSNIVISS